MDPSFQSAFNVVKGSVPARTDVPDTDFDACGKKAHRGSGRGQRRTARCSAPSPTATASRRRSRRRLRRRHPPLQRRSSTTRRRPRRRAEAAVSGECSRSTGSPREQAGRRLRSPPWRRGPAACDAGQPCRRSCSPQLPARAGLRLRLHPVDDLPVVHLVDASCRVHWLGGVPLRAPVGQENW